MATMLSEHRRRAVGARFPNLTLKHLDATSECAAGFYSITPAMADTILKDRNEHNRRCATAKVSQLITDIQAGAFTLNGESIIFSSDGQLLDGQHRLLACSTSGAGIESVVVFGISPKAQDSVDQGKVRGAGDILVLDGEKNGNELAAVARSLIAYRRMDGSGIGNRGVITRAEIVKTVNDNPDLAVCTAWALHLKGNLKGVCSPSIIAFCRVILERAYGEEAVYYLERVSLGDNIAINDPAFTARKRLIDSPIKTLAVRVEVIFRGAVAHMEGRPLMRIQLEQRLPTLPTLRKAAA